jgi:hypothetical protein
VHLSKSLSGEYVQNFLSAPPSSGTAVTLEHITSIDQHRHWEECGLQPLVDKIKPQYLVHELYYNNFAELGGYIQRQQRLLAKD